MATEPVRRRRFAASVRSMMLFVLIIACVLGWLAHRARRQRIAVEAIKLHGGWVHYDYEFVNGKLTAGREPWAPRWLRRLVGDEYFQDVVHVNLVYDDSTGKRLDNRDVGDEALAYLDHLPNIRALFLKETQATDEGMKHVGRLTGLEEFYMWDARELTDVGVARLVGLRNLKEVHIDRSKMTDEGLKHLGGLGQLEEMALQGNRFTDRGLEYLGHQIKLRRLYVGAIYLTQEGRVEITDDGIDHLRSLNALEVLDLQNSRITDLGLEKLGAFPNLKEIWIGGCHVTDRGIDRLRQAKPNLIIHR